MQNSYYSQPKNIIPIILAGGVGTRLWPISRPDLPKQFQIIIGEKTLFQQTILRLQNTQLDKKPIIMTNQGYLHLVQSQLAELNINDVDIISEPCCQDTAPAILIAAMVAFKRDSNCKIMTFPSDHLLKNMDVFSKEFLHESLVNDHFIAFGVKPNKPSSAFGYIKYDPNTKTALKNIEKFIEKPNSQTAEKFIKHGNYLWNSGIYLFPAAKLIDQLQKLDPALVNHCSEALFKGYEKSNILFLDHRTFKKTRKISIDHALMEKIQNAKVMKVSANWNDIGSWAEVWECSVQDTKGNVKVGNVITSNSYNSYVRSDNQLTTVLGLDNIIVITMDDVVLIADKSESQNLKQLVQKLSKAHYKETVAHSSVYRPWGHYKTIEGGEKYQVKHIRVNPGQKLSLQYHFHRSEHWTIVSGRAQVTLDDKVQILNENDDIYIPIEAVHSISNPFDEPVDFIEIQYGDYLGEDDIIRLEDIYDRIPQ